MDTACKENCIVNEYSRKDEIHIPEAGTPMNTFSLYQILANKELLNEHRKSTSTIKK
jgi:hypothetical protein